MEVVVTDENFKAEVLDAKIPVLVDFWAEWCMPCKMIAPTVEAIAKEYEGKLKVCKLNVDDAPVTATQYSVMSIPTLLLFKNGKVVDKTVGVVPKAAIDAKLKPLL
ncbi:thioredoxin [Candidatus Desantisbacteria bacterium CG_4_10_14_0_8_um_filter_48_22]|uniref:Thioredoxin n=1 Tax=Candidatus Desantisbacteria bacterium CG_4_10_14_0_8_um_filter_48_22 TaxID=1974543 RepID=A0A2M7S6J5_9BACT|nr:MAG: thioredoxin [Candidatus Desantisbacteria bacterium CG02_land_8_20_14_3_00_49_13]PIZ15147.1 MAG: thioredoxin [Candidatus Desantisbacteria bacterium CG_4_10_14_0_8_um_filter_48_22]